jgi:hypothetical protein
MMANNEGTAMADGLLHDGEVTEHVTNASFAVRVLRRVFTFIKKTVTSSDDDFANNPREQRMDVENQIGRNNSSAPRSQSTGAKQQAAVLNNMALQAAANVASLAASASLAALAAAGAGAIAGVGSLAAGGLVGAVAGASTAVQVGLVLGTTIFLASAIATGVAVGDQRAGAGAVSSSIVTRSAPAILLQVPSAVAPTVVAGPLDTIFAPAVVTPTLNPNYIVPLSVNNGFGEEAGGPNALGGGTTPPANIPGLTSVTEEWDLLFANATYPLCDSAPGIDFESGYFSVIFSGGFIDVFPDRFRPMLENAVVELYNVLSGGCTDIFQRLVMKAHLSDQTTLAVSDTKPGVNDLLAYFMVDLQCNGCPPDKPLFNDQRVIKERILQSDSIVGDGEKDNVIFIDFLLQLLRRIQLKFSELAKNETGIFDSFLLGDISIKQGIEMNEDREELSVRGHCNHAIVLTAKWGTVHCWIRVPVNVPFKVRAPVHAPFEVGEPVNVPFEVRAPVHVPFEVQETVHIPIRVYGTKYANHQQHLALERTCVYIYRWSYISPVAFAFSKH